MLVLDTHPHGGKPMVMEDLITELFCRIDDAMENVAKHAQAKLHPSEIVALAVLSDCVGHFVSGGASCCRV